MANYGIKISKAGYDIVTTGIANQIFNSEKNCIKLATVGTSTATSLAAAGSTTNQVAHGLGFAPGFMIWFEIDNDGDWYFQYTSTVDYIGCGGSSDSTNLDIAFYNNDSSTHTIVAYYAIFADRGS